MEAVSRLTRAGRAALVALVLTVAAIVAAAPAAHQAHAAPNSISATGGPEQIYVTGSGFSPSATARLVVLDSSTLKEVGSPQYVPGSTLMAGTYVTGLGSYSGSVYVLADQAPLPTAGATTTVLPEPAFLVNGTYQQSCGYPVRASAYGFMRYYNVRIEMLSADLTKLLGSTWTTADGAGDVSTTFNTSYTGEVWLVADETNGPTGPPFYVTVGYYLNIC